MIATFPTPGISTTPSINGCIDFKDFVKKGQILSYNAYKATEETESGKNGPGAQGCIYGRRILPGQV